MIHIILQLICLFRLKTIRTKQSQDKPGCRRKKKCTQEPKSQSEDSSAFQPENQKENGRDRASNKT